MPNHYKLYHAQFAPNGQLFTERDGTTPQAQAKLGWADNPAKVGVNLWEKTPEMEAHIAGIHRAVQDGQIPMIDDPHFTSRRDERQANDEVSKREARDADYRQEESLAQKAKQKQESFEEEVAEAAGLADKQHADAYGYQKESKGEKVEVKDHVNGESTDTAASEYDEVETSFADNPIEFLAAVIAQNVENGVLAKGEKPTNESFDGYLAEGEKVTAQMRNKAWKLHLAAEQDSATTNM